MTEPYVISQQDKHRLRELEAEVARLRGALQAFINAYDSTGISQELASAYDIAQQALTGTSSVKDRELEAENLRFRRILTDLNAIKDESPEFIKGYVRELSKIFTGTPYVAVRREDLEKYVKAFGEGKLIEDIFEIHNSLKAALGES